MKKKRILIADDDRQLVTALALRFKEAGYAVIASVDSYQALERAVTKGPDVIILDINMPCGSGLTVQERLARIPGMPTVPIIYLTGEKSARVDALPSKPGVFAVVHKPFEMAEFLETIRRALAPAAA
jgi:DNA-binding response OmpR family regulator